MNPAETLLDEVFEKGIHVTVKNGDLKCRASKPISAEIITRLRIHKNTVLQMLKKRDQQKAKPYLSENGEFMCPGLLPPWTLFDTLLELGASNEEIEKHVNRFQMPTAWAKWQLIKTSRSIN